MGQAIVYLLAKVTARAPQRGIKQTMFLLDKRFLLVDVYLESRRTLLCEAHRVRGTCAGTIIEFTVGSIGPYSEP